MDGRGEEEKAVVEVLAVPAKRERGVIGELEIEIVTTGLKGGEVEGVGGPDREIVHQDEETAIGGAIGGECAAADR